MFSGLMIKSFNHIFNAPCRHLKLTNGEGGGEGKVKLKIILRIWPESSSSNIKEENNTNYIQFVYTLGSPTKPQSRVKHLNT